MGTVRQIVYVADFLCSIKLEGNVVKNAQVKAQVKNEEKGPQQGGPQA